MPPDEACTIVNASSREDQASTSDSAVSEQTDTILEPRLTWNHRLDIALLKAIDKHRPITIRLRHGVLEAWERVARDVSDSIQTTRGRRRVLKRRNIFNRWKILVKHFRAKKLSSMRAQGTKEDFEEKKRRLAELVRLMDECGPSQERPTAAQNTSTTSENRDPEEEETMSDVARGLVEALREMHQEKMEALASLRQTFREEFARTRNVLERMVLVLSNHPERANMDHPLTPPS